MQEDFEDGCIVRRITICNHIFHEGCLEGWLKYNEACPICGKSLNREYLRVIRPNINDTVVQTGNNNIDGNLSQRQNIDCLSPQDLNKSVQKQENKDEFCFDLKLPKTKSSNHLQSASQGLCNEESIEDNRSGIYLMSENRPKEKVNCYQKTHKHTFSVNEYEDPNQCRNSTDKKAKKSNSSSKKRNYFTKDCFDSSSSVQINKDESKLAHKIRVPKLEIHTSK